MPCQMLLEFYDSLVPINVFRFGLNHSPQIQVLNLLRNWKSWKEKQKKKKLRDGRIEQCILIWIISCDQHVSCHVHVYCIFDVSWYIFLLVKLYMFWPMTVFNDAFYTWVKHLNTFTSDRILSSNSYGLHLEKMIRGLDHCLWSLFVF